MKCLINAIRNGWAETKERCDERIKDYWQHRGEMIYIKGLVLKGDRIVVPKSLRKEILDAIHTGHLGMNKCKGRARQSVYWPRINYDIETLISKCGTCVSLQPSKSKEPLVIPVLPTRAWEMVGSDLFQCGAKHYLIITDYYSCFPEVYLLKSQEADYVILATKDVFARHGVPVTLILDNGP